MISALKLRPVLVFFAPIALLYMISLFWMIAINQTGSLQYTLFLVRKSVLPVKGQYIIFRAPGNGLYNKPFIKLVGGVEGDAVTRDGYSYYVNGKYIGKAKEFSKSGNPVKLGPVGDIPQGNYFVYTNNKDSYDSRYEEIGWVKSSNIIGVAYPIY